jgi:periplasmic protein TonB
VQSIGNPIPATPRRPMATHAACSIGLHLLALLLIAGLLHRSPRHIAPFRLPGTAHGTNFVVAYMPGRAPEQAAMAKAKTDPQPVAPKTASPTPSTHQTKPSPLPSVTTSASPQPDSATGADALGSGNITIALTAYFPPPRPDLSVLPHGTRGDVILDIVIDTNGRISDLKKMSGVGYGIDELVIATVQQWIFHPALQNGHPVASEQELHFHYERS